MSEKEFNAYLRGPVRNRIMDEEHRVPFESDLRALATTDMASETLERLLASESEKEPWEIGEALAECLLEEEHGVKWPWNTERDKRTPKASLPGADLIGFIESSGGILLLLGEVKTSNDSCTPPNTMYGKSGMVHQLDRLACNLQIHGCLLKWLHARCKNTDLWSTYQSAIKKYLESGGRALVLFGLLMRDTGPHELDLKNRAQELVGNVADPARMELNAWYLPRPIDEWPSLLSAGSE